jgi:hypothetical protein
MGSFSQQTNGAVVGDGEEEGLEGGKSIRFVSGLPDFYKDLLYNFFGILLLFDIPQYKTIQPSAISFIKVVKSNPVILLDQQQKLLV